MHAHPVHQPVPADASAGDSEAEAAVWERWAAALLALLSEG